jgi:hypothetical protein
MAMEASESRQFEQNVWDAEPWDLPGIAAHKKWKVPPWPEHLPFMLLAFKPFEGPSLSSIVRK